MSPSQVLVVFALFLSLACSDIVPARVVMIGDIHGSFDGVCVDYFILFRRAIIFVMFSYWMYCFLLI